MRKEILLILTPIIALSLSDLQYFQSAVQEGKEGLAEAMYAGLETKYQKAATNAFKAKFTREPKPASGAAQKIEASSQAVTEAIAAADSPAKALTAFTVIADTTGHAVVQGLIGKGVAEADIRKATEKMFVKK